MSIQPKLVGRIRIFLSSGKVESKFVPVLNQVPRHDDVSFA